MNIKEWEEYIKSKYKVMQTYDFEELRYYLSDNGNYPEFTPSEVTEGQFADNEFFSAYLFDEREILKKDAITYNSGWATTIVLLASNDGETILDYSVLGLNGFDDKSVRKFFEEVITPIGDGQAEMR